MQNSYKVKRQLTYFIVPFAYENDYNHVIDLFKESQRWNNKIPSTNYLFKHIDKLIAGDDSSSIGKIYSLNNNCRREYGLPNNAATYINYKNKKHDFRFQIRDILLYVFETNVAFVIFEVNYDESADLDSIIDYNYVLKKLQYSTGTLSYIKNRNTGEKVNITITKLVMDLISEFKVKTFFIGKEGLPGQAIVYNVAYIQDKPTDDEIEAYMYWLRRSFKESYMPSCNELELKGNREILRPFENSYWGVSLEGVANLVYSTDNDTTNTFFGGNYFGNIKNTYFYTFMLVLHQRYALLYLSILASEIKLTINNDINTINKLKEKIIMFNLRCSFNHVTVITHQSRLYEMVRKNLHVEELMNELHFELSVLSNMVEMEYQKEEEKAKSEEEKRQEKFNTVIVFATTAFVMISTAADAWGVIEVFRDDIMLGHLSTSAIVYIVVLLSILGLGLVGLIVFLKNLFGKK